MENTPPKIYPSSLRIVFTILGLIVIGFTFHIMSKLSQPSLYVSAIEIVKEGAQSADNIKKLSFLNFKNYLYLHGSIVSATLDSEEGKLFLTDSKPTLLPSTFVDKTGAVEVLAPNLPLAAEPIDAYLYKQSYHILGWRTGSSGFTLFAIGESQQSLLSLLENKSKGWKVTLFVYGFIMSILVFAIFWLLNMSLLSTPYLETVQLFIVNTVFLVLFYSVLFLSGYPLLSTLLQTLEILALSNIIFIPLFIFIQKKEAA